MNELSIEEKAKRYDKALERADKLKETCDSNAVVGWMEYIFPELRESEDEKIKKIVKDFVENYLFWEKNELTKEKALTWLEKQGEQKCTAEEILIKAGLKPYKDGDQWCILLGDNIQEGICGFGDTVDEALYKFLKELLEKKGEQKPVVIPKFRIGDIIKDTEDGEVFTIRTITKDKYIYTDDSFDWIKDQDEYELVEQKPTDEEMKELLHTEYEKGRADAIEEMQKPWNEEDMEMSRFIGNAITADDASEYLESKGIQVIDAHVWLDELKDRVQPKQEWSEEDIELLNNTIKFIEDSIAATSPSLRTYSPTLTGKEIPFLKALKGRVQPQSQWKPSEGQLECLGYAIDKAEKDWSPLANNRIYLTLKALKEQLEKL